MTENPEDIRYLRGLAMRLRTLAVAEPRVADQLEQMAGEAEARANQLAGTHQPRLSP